MVITRQTDYEADRAEGSASREQPEDNPIERRRRWSALLQTLSHPQLITEVLSHELPKYRNSTVIDITHLPDLYRECMLILASAPQIFSAAVDGDLTIRFPTDTNLQAEYAIIHQRSHTQPSIYVQLLADDHGISPSANQYLTISTLATQYATPTPSYHPLANTIDTIQPPRPTLSTTLLGHRKYLSTARHPLSPTRLSTLRIFTSAIHTRWLLTPPQDRNTPFPHPPSEVGYSINSPARLTQHTHHQSSNYIMNLTSSICTHLFRTHHPLFATQHFTMHQFVIYLIFRPQQVRIAEIFCSALLQGWIEAGTGFGYYPAGRSCASAGGVTGEDWGGFEEFARREGELEERWRVQRERIEGFVVKVGREVGRIWREVFEREGVV